MLSAFLFPPSRRGPSFAVGGRGGGGGGSGGRGRQAGRKADGQRGEEDGQADRRAGERIRPPARYDTARFFDDR